MVSSSRFSAESQLDEKNVCESERSWVDQLTALLNQLVALCLRFVDFDWLVGSRACVLSSCEYAQAHSASNNSNCRL
jgi:hypothetical protein